jgi:hypothetical protein
MNLLKPSILLSAAILSVVSFCFLIIYSQSEIMNHTVITTTHDSGHTITEYCDVGWSSIFSICVLFCTCILVLCNYDQANLIIGNSWLTIPFGISCLSFGIGCSCGVCHKIGNPDGGTPLYVLVLMQFYGGILAIFSYALFYLYKRCNKSHNAIENLSRIEVISI